MKDLEIGEVIIEYSPDGSVKLADFVPTMHLHADTQLLQQLMKIKERNNDQDAIKNNSDLIFAGWINKVNEIELADQEKYEIKSEVVTCERYNNDRIKKCIIRYFFTERFIPELN